MRLIRRFLRKNGKKAAWFFRPLDVTDYVAGFVGLERPWSLDSVAKAIGVPELPPGARHTALGDAMLARDVYLKASELKNRIEFFKASLRGVRSKHEGLVLNGGDSLDTMAEAIAKAQAEIVEASKGERNGDKSGAPAVAVVKS